MEFTTYFLAVDSDSSRIAELKQAFGNGHVTDDKKIYDYFKHKAQRISLPEGFGFETFESSAVAIEASFISGSTTARDFLAPLSKSVQHVIGTLSNDEEGPTQCFAYIDGKKATSDATKAAMQRVAGPADLCSLGRTMKLEATAAEDPTQSLLLAISRKQKLDVINAQLKNGADPNVVDTRGQSALDCAIGRRDTALIECLLEHGASLTKRLKKNDIRPSYLAEAIQLGPARAVMLLINAGANPAQRDSYFQRYPIELAIETNSSDMVEMLVAHGAKTSGLTDMGSLTALLLARFAEYGKVSRKLAILQILARDPACRADIHDNCATYIDMAHRNYALGIVKNDRDDEALKKIVAFIESA